MELGNVYGGREGIIVYERTSHPSNIEHLANRYVANSISNDLEYANLGSLKLFHVSIIIMCKVILLDPPGSLAIYTFL